MVIIKADSNVTLGIVVALPAEGRAVLGWGFWQRVQGRLVRSVQLDEGTKLICVCAGVGPKAARGASRWLIRQEVSVLASLGVSGGLHSTLQPGHIVVAEGVLEDTGRKDMRLWHVDGALVERACEALDGAGMISHRGKIVTTGEAVLTASAKRALYKRTRGLCVDMESGAVAGIAAESAIRFFSLRSVCDSVDQPVTQDLVDCVGQGGEIRIKTLIRKVLRKPSLMFDLLRMRRHFTKALNSLSRAWRIQVKHNLPALLNSGQ